MNISSERAYYCSYCRNYPHFIHADKNTRGLPIPCYQSAYTIGLLTFCSLRKEAHFPSACRDATGVFCTQEKWVCKSHLLFASRSEAVVMGHVIIRERILFTTGYKYGNEKYSLSFPSYPEQEKRRRLWLYFYTTNNPFWRCIYWIAPVEQQRWQKWFLMHRNLIIVQDFPPTPAWRDVNYSLYLI